MLTMAVLPAVTFLVRRCPSQRSQALSALTSPSVESGGVFAILGDAFCGYHLLVH